jgi:hypothetical protein
MIGWHTRLGMRVAQRVHFRPEFVRALQQLTKERGGGYIPLSEVEARADRVVMPLPLPLPLPPLPLPLPVLP